MCYGVPKWIVLKRSSPHSLSLPPPKTLPHDFDSDLTIRAALVFQGDRGPWLRPVWLRAKAPLWTDARGIQSTHWPRIVWSQVTVSLGQQLKDAGSMGPVRGKGFTLAVSFAQNFKVGKL